MLFSTRAFPLPPKNISEGTVFMGFKSNRKIGWVELELVKGASNGGIAVGALSFGD